jgi:HAE1 family hydrophobic/amphiphilic exporter-1
VAVQANTEGRPLSDVVSAIEARLGAELELPPGYIVTQGGQTEEQREVFTRIFTALGVAVALMYLVLVVQFGSFLDPVAIMVSLPLSLIGVVGALMLTGDTLNIMSLIGVILLMGIVKKNSIMLVEYATHIGENEGLDAHRSMLKAGPIRLRPILMTTFALVAGMIPVALGQGEGADFRAPLGRAVIGGVITSTFLTLLVIPTIYDILAGWRDGLRSLFTRGAPAHAAEPREDRVRVAV